jgi:amidase
MPVDLETASVAELLHLLTAGLTRAELTQAYLDRTAALNPVLNAVRAINPHALTEEAEGPLAGIPVLLKDNIDVRGMPTTAGSLALEHSYPAADATLVTNLRAAGAVILGKTNLTELANFLAEDMPGGYSALGGQVLNPYDASQSPRGSSAGSAVAAAAGLAAVTVGTETSGSILSPASATSGVGIKPTVGLISRAGIVPIASSQDTPGPMTRSVSDAAYLLTALTSIDDADPATRHNPLADYDFTDSLRREALRGARIGVVGASLDDPLWTAALAALKAQGATLVEVDLDTSAPDDLTVLDYEFKRDLNKYLKGLPAPPRSLAEVIEYNAAHEREELKFGQARALSAQAKDLSPDSPDTARYIEDRRRSVAASKDRIDPLMREKSVTALLFPGIGSSAIGALAGYPSVVVPAGYQASNRRPFSISFLGHPGASQP